MKVLQVYTKDDLKTFFEHINKQQCTYVSPYKVFRFQKITAVAKGKSDPVPTKYPTKITSVAATTIESSGKAKHKKTTYGTRLVFDVSHCS